MTKTVVAFPAQKITDRKNQCLFCSQFWMLESNEHLDKEFAMKHSFIAAAALLMSLPAMAASPNGKALFQENCATCHGPSGQGGVGPKLVGDASHWKTKVFERAVLNGVDDEG